MHDHKGRIVFVLAALRSKSVERLISLGYRGAKEVSTGRTSNSC